MIAVYAITDDLGPPLPDIGSLRLVSATGLAAVCAPAVEEEITPQALWRHEELVEAVMVHRDLLPVRFGTQVPDDGAAARAIRARRSELEAALDRVRGAVELSVRVAKAADVDSEPATQSGAEYVRARTELDGWRSEVRDAVHAPLARLARAAAQRAARPSELLRACYLVDRAAVGEFARRVAELDRERPDLHVLCTGPWPPYSFAEP